MKVSELKSEYYLFGNKGTVWSDNAHIAKSGDHRTLCGTPMLSSNHARLNNLEYAKCEKCNIKYKDLNRVDYDFNEN